MSGTVASLRTCVWGRWNRRSRRDPARGLAARGSQVRIAPSKPFAHVGRVQASNRTLVWQPVGVNRVVPTLTGGSMRSIRRFRSSAFGLVALLGLGACGGDGGAGVTSNNLSDAQAWVLGDMTSTQLSTVSTALINFNFYGSGLNSVYFARGSAPGQLLSELAARAPAAEFRQGYSAFLAYAPCAPALSDTTDSDADGVPNDLLLTWGCSVIDTVLGGGFSATGKVRLRDVVDAATGFGYHIDFDQFRVTTTTVGGTATYATVLDGSYSTSVNGSSAVADQDLAWEFHKDGQRLVQHSWDWRLVFTPDTPINWATAQLPAGSFELNGDLFYSGDTGGNGSGTWSFRMSTLSLVDYDGSCDLDPPFSSGLITGSLVGRSDVGFGVTYTSCGSYTPWSIDSPN